MDNNMPDDREAQQERIRQEQEASLREQLEAGVAFEEMTHSKGFDLVKAYVSQQIVAFTNQALNEGFTDMLEYREARGRISGLRGLLSRIDSAMQTLEDERQKPKPTT